MKRHLLDRKVSAGWRRRFEACSVPAEPESSLVERPELVIKQVLKSEFDCRATVLSAGITRYVLPLRIISDDSNRVIIGYVSKQGGMTP